MLEDSRTHKKRTSDMSSTTDSGSLNHASDVIHFKFRLPLALNLKLTYSRDLLEVAWVP